MYDQFYAIKGIWVDFFLKMETAAVTGQMVVSYKTHC
jgi:hypothetical protein